MSSHDEFKSIDMAKKIISQLKPNDDPSLWIEHVEDRHYHDQRYLVNNKTLLELGWEPKTSFHDGFNKTIEWYVNYAVPDHHWTYDVSITNLMHS